MAIYSEPLRTRFAAAAADGDVELGALLIAKLHQPEMEVALQLRRLDGLGVLASRAVGDGGPRELARWLFREFGFRGNEERYSDPRNSFLDQVLERRLGIPITLALLYAAVAERVGIRAWLAPLPGHVIAVAEHAGEQVLIDAFGHGRELSREGAERLARRAAPHVGDIAPFLKPAPPALVLSRMLLNLKALHVEASAWGPALQVVDWMLALSPDSPAELLHRGLLLLREGASLAASRDLQRWRALSAASDEASRIDAALAAVWN